jgi:hypothetical protein
MSLAEISEKIIALDVKRGSKFMRALGTRPELRAALAPRSYTEEEHQRMWGLLLILMGYSPKPAAPQGPNENLASLTYIDNSDGPLLRAIKAVLEDRYPDSYGYIVGSLTAATGTAAVAVVQQIVDRYAAVRDGTDPARQAKREEDKKAAEALASRAVLDAAIEADFRRHLERAQAIAPKIGEAPATEAQKKYQEAAREFHISLKEWREIARQTITRRDYLISLGLAERRRTKGGAPDVDDDDDDDRPMD